MFWRKKKRKQNEAALQEALAAMEHTASLDPFVKAVLGGQAEILRVMPKLEALKAKIATTANNPPRNMSPIVKYGIIVLRTAVVFLVWASTKEACAYSLSVLDSLSCVRSIGTAMIRNTMLRTISITVNQPIKLPP